MCVCVISLNFRAKDAIFPEDLQLLPDIVVPFSSNEHTEDFVRVQLGSSKNHQTRIKRRTRNVFRSVLEMIKDTGAAREQIAVY